VSEEIGLLVIAEKELSDEENGFEAPKESVWSRPLGGCRSHVVTFCIALSFFLLGALASNTWNNNNDTTNNSNHNSNNFAVRKCSNSPDPHHPLSPLAPAAAAAATGEAALVAPLSQPSISGSNNNNNHNNHNNYNNHTNNQNNSNKNNNSSSSSAAAPAPSTSTSQLPLPPWEQSKGPLCSSVEAATSGHLDGPRHGQRAWLLSAG
ncbi:unnamed protein product, partial [Polarella glacialis]